MARTRKDPTLWRTSDSGTATYRETRALAQSQANESGCDYGIEANDLFQTWRSFMLPQRRNRSGHELQCEVVSCENLDRCQPGHGPR